MTARLEAPRGHRESERWEELYLRTRRAMWLRRRRLRAFGFDLGERIVELGCGDGLNLEILRREGCTRLLGADLALPLLRRVSAAPVFAGDLYALPMGDASADAVLIDSVLHHVAPLPPALAEIRRVLRPGGRLCALEPRPSLPRRAFERMMDLAPLPPPLRTRQLAYLEERDVDRAWNRYFPRLRADLREAGFTVLEWRPLPFGVALQARRA